MKKRTKKKRILTMSAVVGVLLLLPLQALAAICFNVSPFTDVAVIELAGQGGDFFSLVGEVVNWCGSGTSMPLSGSAHLRSDGKAHFGVSIHGPVGAPTATCVPGWYQGTLSPPSFNSGSGFHRNDLGTVTAITFVPVSCPLIPQQPNSGLGQGGGTISP